MSQKTHMSLFGNKEHRIGRTSKTILEAIHNHWPTNPLEVARELGDEIKDVKTVSARYLYHFRKLRDAELIHLKRLGNTYIAWPIEVEKIRLIHEMVRE